MSRTRRRQRVRRGPVYVLVAALSLSNAGCVGDILGMLTKLPVVGGLFGAIGGLFGGGAGGGGGTPTASGAGALTTGTTTASGQVSGDPPGAEADQESAQIEIEATGEDETRVVPEGG